MKYRQNCGFPLIDAHYNANKGDVLPDTYAVAAALMHLPLQRRVGIVHRAAILTGGYTWQLRIVEMLVIAPGATTQPAREGVDS